MSIHNSIIISHIVSESSLSQSSFTDVSSSSYIAHAPDV